MRVLVLGAGSAGSRHARCLLALGAEVTLSDPDGSRAQDVDGADAVAFDLNNIGGYDGIVIASPPVYHHDQAMSALETGAKVLVEKPMSIQVDRLDELVRVAGRRLMVGYNLRLHKPLERLAALVKEGYVGKPLGLRLWFGSYLPDWRPGVDYRKTYSAKKELGGGVLYDAIHELDLAVWLLGPGLEVVCSEVARLGDLEIDVEDSVRALIRTGSGVQVEVSLDYLSRKYRRGVEVVGDEATIRFDWARGILEREDSNGLLEEPITTDISISYQRQAKRFLDWLDGTQIPPVDAAEGAVSVRLAAAIRTAAG